MTRKHFEIVARILAKFGDIDDETKDDINHLLTQANYNFNSTRFWKYVEKCKEAFEK